MKKLIFSLLGALALVSCGGNCQKDATACAQSDSAAVINNIMNRRSIRAYKDAPVEREKLELIATCGINAPSGMNYQPWQLRIVDNPEYINDITELFKAANPEMASKPDFKNMFRNATALIFVAGPADGSGDLDCGLLGENMVLAAEAIGLGTCIQAGPLRWMTTAPEAAPYVEKLNIPEDYKLLYLVGVGYPDETPAAKPRDAGKIQFVE